MPAAALQVDGGVPRISISRSGTRQSPVQDRAECTPQGGPIRRGGSTSSASSSVCTSVAISLSATGLQVDGGVPRVSRSGIGQSPVQDRPECTPQGGPATEWASAVPSQLQLFRIGTPPNPLGAKRVGDINTHTGHAAPIRDFVRAARSGTAVLPLRQS